MKVKVFDGAMGSVLQKNGLKLGGEPEFLNIEKPDIIRDIHKQYIESGCDFLTTNTFGANDIKLKNKKYGVDEIIREGIKLAKEARGNNKALIALDIGPTGQLLEPMGTLTFDEAYNAFKKVVLVGVNNGVDVVLIETMTDLYEAKAAILAVKENSDLPVFCTMSFEQNERTFTGCNPESMVMTLEALGVDVIGVNCSLGPKELKGVIERILKVATVPVMIQPNAGLPKIVNGKTIYNIDIEEFCECVVDFVHKGVSIIGGCCGTTPEYIGKLKKLVSEKKVKRLNNKKICGICTPSKVINVDGVRVIGERINPTGKKLFKEALKKGDMDYILGKAIEQVEVGAHILDVNVGIPDINEEETMVKVVKEIQSILDIPLQIDSSNYGAIEKGLRYYNGKAIVNSINGEEEVLHTLLPIVKKYGASVVGLTLDKNGIPKKAEERYKIAEKIVNVAKEYGIEKEDIFIDALVLTASTQQEEVKETLKAVSMIKNKLGVKTVLGVSNISFGLPDRPLINKTFLTLALGAGLDLPIINPNEKSMMDAINAFNVLYNYDKDSFNFIKSYSNTQKETIKSKDSKDNKENLDIKSIVIRGLKEKAGKATKELLKEVDELTIVNEYLIPALDEVGERFEKGILFLPQLITSAETAKKAFLVIKESLMNKKEQNISKGKIILATVKGDIHDIGKNIVKVILENYGYEIIDLGKDVPINKVVEETKKQNVKLVGLSALMTTTLKSMEETIKALKNENLDCKVFVGGAVLTKDYGEKIGADFFAKDARESVDIAKKVLG